MTFAGAFLGANTLIVNNALAWRAGGERVSTDSLTAGGLGKRAYFLFGKSRYLILTETNAQSVPHLDRVIEVQLS
jgi:hypothetical protein